MLMYSKNLEVRAVGGGCRHERGLKAGEQWKH